VVGILVLTHLPQPEEEVIPTATIPLPSVTLTRTATRTTTPTPTQTITATITLTPTITKTDPVLGSLGEGLVVLALTEGGYSHLFAYQPQTLPLTRLTNHPWDDITPSLNPDGQRIAYSSRQNGYWNLYMLDLISGETLQLTDDPTYQANPSWSPDGKWLVYEQYENGNWDLFILAVDDPTQSPTQLTTSPNLENSPDWSPEGRKIAFVSNSTGENDIWVADLNQIEDRFINISNNPSGSEDHPAWSPDGTQLAWASTSGGTTNILVWNSLQPDLPPRLLGTGNWPIWSPDGKLILTLIQDPNQDLLIAYQSDTGSILMPAEFLKGSLQGLDWSAGNFPDSIPENLANIRKITPTPIWESLLTTSTENPSIRQNVVSLGDVTAPYSYLADSVDESFQALRLRVADEIGWDFLASLENAFVPLDNPLPPGENEDWLYTGRSIQVNTIPINAGWMLVVKEEFGDQTFWRLFLKARYQDGSQGTPIDQSAWDLNARYNGDSLIYEQGGALVTTFPSGYWLDFTNLAMSYGWERLPSLINWRIYYPGIRFNQYVLRGNLDWESAMLEIYPSTILTTSTPILPPTSTPTSTSRWMTPRTPTPTPSPTITSTFRATWTPLAP
jgi:TolB protein